jgi:hypothetical protein
MHYVIYTGIFKLREHILSVLTVLLQRVAAAQIGGSTPTRSERASLFPSWS